MPTLDELKQKWFLQDVPFPPFDLPVRHANASVSISTDNNLVDVLSPGQLNEGHNYLLTWKGLIDAANSVPGSTFLHTAWKLDLRPDENHPNLPDACKILEEQREVVRPMCMRWLTTTLASIQTHRDSLMN